jgi:HK97 family phage portal protein
VSLWFRHAVPAAERRSGPISTPMYAALFTGGASYQDAVPTSAESNLRSVAVGSSVDLIASLGSELPVHVYSDADGRRTRRRTPGYLLDPAGDGYGLPDWSYKALTSWLLRGNLYGDILNTGPGGVPTQIELHHPDQVSGWLEDGQPRWQVAGKPVDDPARFLHRRVNPMPGQVLGLSPIGLKAAQIGLSLTSTQFGLQWFRDGGHPGGMLVNEERNLTGEQAKTAKERFLAALRGAREPVVLDRGWKYQQIQIAPEESQFLQTQQFTEAQCARIFGPGVAEVLGYESGGSLTYATVEGRSTHLLVYSVNKWLRRLERLLTEMLPRPQYALIDRAGLLQSTTLDRYRAYESGLRNRWLTVNEVRADEDLEPVDWGDEPNLTYIGQSTTVQEELAEAEAPEDGN